ncbi:arylesterase [Phenylobacterium sp.]|jgi:acyl-CoA thioesterase-1|uniref:arylesterase n=1 Tax=Phenylobacterium sp. TaxID=1871053 RepID=UPI002E372B45|nr:arylesterase [Phenylobacterium sp.]HEX2558669.1 arylesterase [Phenylobacterium sp.]
MHSKDVTALSRRALIAAGLAALAGPALGAPARRVALLGDSIASGYGLPASQALPARLQAELARMGVPAKVIGAGRSGDTTAGGAARVDRAVPKDVELCVVALGGNDLLTGTDPSQVQANLDRIVRRLKARGVKVVLAGVQVPPILGGGYARAFNGAFAKVAKAHGVLFLPDMLSGISLNPNLNQPDGIHPNAQGVAVIARRLAPLVARGLSAR